MKSHSVLASLFVCIVAFAPLHANDFVPFQLHGFNRDVVVEAGSTDPPYDTAQSFDLSRVKNSVNNTAFYEEGFVPPKEAKPVDRGLPKNRELVVASISAIFQLNAYDQNNSLRLTSGTSAALTLAQKDRQAYSRIAILAASGNTFGAATAPMTITFVDESTFTTTINAHDWFGVNSDVAASDFGRVTVHSGRPGGSRGDPRLYYTVVDIPQESANKSIAGFTFTWDRSGFLNVMAASGHPHVRPPVVAGNSPAATRLCTRSSRCLTNRCPRRLCHRIWRRWRRCK
jgi:hypothetical protein